MAQVMHRIEECFASILEHATGVLAWFGANDAAKRHGKI
jgi:hypothetical protein